MIFRGQLLLLDPMPPINKVFSLVSKEENQRKITTRQILNVDSSNTMAFLLGLTIQGVIIL